MKDGYKSIDKILEEVWQEEKQRNPKIKLSNIKDVWKYNIEYLQHLQEDEETVAIKIPYIGTLSLNLKQFKIEKKGYSKKKYKNFFEKAAKLREDLLVIKRKDSNYKSVHEKMAGLNRLYKYITRTYDTGATEAVHLVRQRETIETIEKYSNDVYQKREIDLVAPRYHKNQRM